MPLGEQSQRVHGVVADRIERDAVSGERGRHSLQLDQLRAAIRSPRGAPIEDDKGAAATTIGVQVDEPAALVGQDDLRETGADLGPDTQVLAPGDHAYLSGMYGESTGAWYGPAPSRCGRTTRRRWSDAIRPESASASQSAMNGYASIPPRQSEPATR